MTSPEQTAAPPPQTHQRPPATTQDHPPRLSEAITYIEYALTDLQEGLLQERTTKLRRLFFRPGGVFFASFSVGLLTLLGWRFLHLSPGASFSLALLLYLALALFYLFRPRPFRQNSLLLADVRRSDEAILDVNRPELLSWPQTHPEQLAEEKATPALFRQSLLARLSQLRHGLQPPTPPTP